MKPYKTSIQISGELQQELSKRKLFDEETHEDVIWGMLEEKMELNEQTKRDIAEARADVEAGRVYTSEEIYRELGL